MRVVSDLTYEFMSDALFLALKIKEKSGSPEGADTGYCVWGNRNPGGGIGTLCLFLGLFKQLSSLRQYGRNKSLTKHC